MRGLADRVMANLARVLVGIFFRDVEVEGGEILRPGVPTVLVANHVNGLVDGLLLMAGLRRYPRFLGKSTLFRIAPLWPFLELAGVVPVYRAKDGGSTEKNSAAFVRCRRLLAAGGMVALFPEGISHDEPALQPLKTGAARIILGATADDGVDGAVSVAVGLVYDAKARFRSRALIRVGPAAPAASWVARYRVDDHAAVRALTDDLAARLRAVSPDYASWRQADELNRIAEIAGRPLGASGPVDDPLAGRARLSQGLVAAESRPEQAPAMASLRDAFGRYDRDLSLLGLSDAQVAASYRPGRIRLMVAWSLAKVFVGLPFAAVGAAVHLVPYETVKRLARLPANEGVKATVKLLGCFASFTAVYLAAGVVVGLSFGPLAGVAAFAAGPACGYVTVLFSERVKRTGGLVAGARVVGERRRVITGVLHNRADVVGLARQVAGGAGP